MLVAAAQFTACEKYVLPDMSVTPDTLRFGPQADSALVHLATNVVTAPNNEGVAWISTWPDWFDEDSDLMVYVKENPGTKQRTGTLLFKSEALQRKLFVIQEGSDSGSSPE